MLKKLSIEQFVIIDKLELDFRTGLTILTGETGAGKSILLDALGLMLGDPPNLEAIRAGAEQAIIQAVFAPAANSAVWPFLIKNGIVTDTDTEFKVYRTQKRSGGEDILINGKPVELEFLRKMGTFLAEIHGQFANQSLLDPSNQQNLLDLSGGFPREVFDNVRNSLHDVQRYARELEEENLFLAKHKRELPKMEDVVGKFEKIGMHVGFIEQLQADYATLLRAKETSEAFQAILAQLISGNGVVAGLSAANNTLARQKNVDREKTAKLSENLAVALENVRGAVLEMGVLSPEYEIDTKPLYRMEEILRLLQTLAKDAKIPFEGLTDYFVDQSTKLARMRNGRHKLKELEDALAKAKREYLHHAHILTEKRIEAGKALSAAITSEFPPLKLMRAEFQVVVEENQTLPWTELGINKVTFTGRMNPGMPFSPISETASGGELARMILALKVVVQRVQIIPTLVFDEVDTGIGGAAAAAVGERLALLADNTQVLVITHSPQVASRGDQHLHVSKQSDGVTTLSVVRTLTAEERTAEISRMLAGDTITAEAQAAAMSLINEARKAGDIRRQNLPA